MNLHRWFIQIPVELWLWIRDFAKKEAKSQSLLITEILGEFKKRHK